MMMRVSKSCLLAAAAAAAAAADDDDDDDDDAARHASFLPYLRLPSSGIAKSTSERS